MDFKDRRKQAAQLEIGNQYGRLTVTGFDEQRTEDRYANHQGHGIFVFAKCECGIEKSYHLGALKSGHTQSCGCSKKDNPKIMEDLRGKTFHRLTVIRRDYDKINKTTSNVYWLCQCSCGNPRLVSVSGYQLKTGQTKSCGCYLHDMLVARNKRRIKYNRPEKYKSNLVEDGVEYMKIYDEKHQYSFLIDSQDYDLISRYYWRKETRDTNTNKHYWITNNKLENIKNGEKAVLKLHQLIAQAKYGEYDTASLVPDHLSRNPDDNRRQNIVLKSYIENAHNRKRGVKNKSGKTGVLKQGNKWIAYITVNYKNIRLGAFNDYQDAVNARIKAEYQYGFTCDDIYPQADVSLL